MQERMISPVEAKVTKFFAEMFEEVDTASDAADFLGAVSINIPFFITMTSRSEGHKELAEAFCESVMEALEAVKEIK